MSAIQPRFQDDARPLSFRATSVVVPLLVGAVALLGIPLATRGSDSGSSGTSGTSWAASKAAPAAWGAPGAWAGAGGDVASIPASAVPAAAQVMDARRWAALERPARQSENDGSVLFVPPGHTAASLLARPFHVYDGAFLAVLGGAPSLTLLAETASDPAFHEACVWHPGTGSVFFAQNAGAPAAGTGLAKSARIQRIDLAEADALVRRHAEAAAQAAEHTGGHTGEHVEPDEHTAEHNAEHVTVHTVPAHPAVINPNGAVLLDDENIVFAGEGQGEDTPSALYLLNPRPPYNTTVLLNNYHGRQFNSLNDVAVRGGRGGRGGWVYFTDVDYGHVQGFRGAVNIPRQVYRFAPGTGAVQAVADGLVRPNGLCFAPDGRTLYVSDTGAARGLAPPDWGLPAAIYRFAVAADGTLGPRELFAAPSPGVPDGVHTDAAGNVYAALGDGVHVWDPAGTLLGKIYVGNTSANFQFTDSGIIILAETRLWYAKIAARGDCIPGLRAAGACK